MADPFGLGPLSPKVLDFAIDFKEDHFELIANNEKFTEFKYVIPIDHIDHIEVRSRSSGTISFHCRAFDEKI